MVGDLFYKNQDIIKHPRIFFAGSPLVHIDKVYGWYRNRKEIINKITSKINLHNPGHLPHELFMNEMKNSKYSLDLLGVGDPNIRTFEIFCSGSLRISQRSNLKWTFNEEFCEETIFDNENDLLEKLLQLENIPGLYEKCLEKQNEIVKNYMNMESIREYVIDKINGWGRNVSNYTKIVEEKKIYVLYSDVCEWSIDFIQHELLGDVNNKIIEPFKKDNIYDLINRQELINNNIFITNSVNNLSDVLNVVKVIKPVSIIFLSDESGDSLSDCKKHNSNWVILQEYTKLFYREYNHNFINYSTNNLQIPLGYVKNFLKQQRSSEIIKKPMNEREINASFVGTLKSDRGHMKKVFENNMSRTYINFVTNNWDFNNLPIPPEDMYNIYSNSVFVINGRGNSNLDCFRIYEAVVCGAIPVIVGNINEITTTFNYNNNIPPFIFADTWENAVSHCNNLLNDIDKLQELQNNMLLWWNNITKNINNQLKKEILNINI
jgi:hypothetical protein